MKISTGTVQSPMTGSGPAVEAAAVEPVAPAPPVRAPGAAVEGALQSAVLQPALAALRDMPDMDQARVAALRDALARGEVPFNAAKLAGLVERFHRSKS
jgi:negative regulator of flagellin synthesis FlgM